MGGNQGANRRASVDEIVKQLLDGDADTSQVTSSLMRNFQQLDNNSHAERDALKNVVASNVILSKTVGKLIEEVKDLKKQITLLKKQSI